MLAGDVLGSAAGPVVVSTGALSLYVVASTPRRMRDRERVAQARDSVLLVAAAKACLGATGSRGRALMALRPSGGGLGSEVSSAVRRTLLGFTVEDALKSAAESVVSYSASEALRSVAELRAESFHQGDEEAKGLATSADLNRETRLPLFMTVCFFAPIMLTLFAVFTKTYSPFRLAGLAGLEFIIVDLTFFLSAYDRGRQ